MPHRRSEVDDPNRTSGAISVGSPLPFARPSEVAIVILINGSSFVAGAIRVIGWIVVFLLLMFGVQMLFDVVSMWLGGAKPHYYDPPRHCLLMSILAIITAIWICRRLDVAPDIPDDDEG
jgi:hypothetical protein